MMKMMMMMLAQKRKKIQKNAMMMIIDDNDDEYDEHRAKHPVDPESKVNVLDRPAAFDKTPPPVVKNPIDIDIIFEDEDLLVVHKPAHLLSVATDRLEIDTLHSRGVDYLKFSNPKAWWFIVHRLDKGERKVLQHHEHL